jgi:hypothetical protein
VSWDGAKLAFGIDETGNVANCVLISSIKNTGQSPAELVALYSHLAIIPVDQSPKIVFSPSGIACNHDIGAGNLFDLRDQLLSTPDAYAVSRGERRCYLLGWAAYRDVFSKEGDTDRVLTFCFEIKLRVAPRLWTKEFVQEHPAQTMISLISIPGYEIGPSGPYK